MTSHAEVDRGSAPYAGETPPNLAAIVGRPRPALGSLQEKCGDASVAWPRAVEAEFGALLATAASDLARRAGTYRASPAHTDGNGPMPCIRPPGRPFITVMVLYTADARQQASADGKDIEDEIRASVDEANRTYARSGIHQRLSLSYVGEIDYPESGDRATDMNRLIDTQNQVACYLDIECWSDRKQNRFWWDPSFDLVEAHILRNRYSADLVNLWRARGGGASRTMVQVDARFESQAFSIVRRKSALTKYSFAHEIGHNMGARHDLAKSLLGSGAFPNSHGYVNLSGGWRTIMAHGVACRAAGTTCPRVGLWSNPDRAYSGDPTGDAQADNRRTLNSTASVVAGFRTLGTNRTGDRFGQTLASGDFNGDGFVDLAVGAPGDEARTGSRDGQVYLFKGTPHGLAPWMTLGPPEPASPLRGHGFGTMLAAGDRDGDGRDDLSVGIPSSAEGGNAETNTPIFVFAGTRHGLEPRRESNRSDRRAVLDGGPAGSTLVTGDFNGDGSPDLAIGAPNAAPDGSVPSGAVFVLVNDGRGPRPYQVLQQEQ